MKRLYADPMHMGIVAQFDGPDALLDAIHALRGKGYRRIDAYVPHEMDGLWPALELERPSIPLIALVAGLTGAALAYLLQWWTQAVDYALNVGDRPFHSAPAFVMITFETAVLFAGVATFLAVLWQSRLPEPSSPLFELTGFQRASVDGFFLGIDERDELFEMGRARQDLLDAGATRILRREQ